MAATATYYIGEMTGDGRAQLLSTLPLEMGQADEAMRKLAQAEKILPENRRRKLFVIDLEIMLPKAAQ